MATAVKTPKKVVVKKSTTKATAAKATKKQSTPKAKTAEEVVPVRQTKYIYPEDVKTSEQKKTFRRKVRAKFNQMTNKIAKAESATEKKKLETEFNRWKKQIYVDPSKAGIGEVG